VKAVFKNLYSLSTLNLNIYWSNRRNWHSTINVHFLNYEWKFMYSFAIYFCKLLIHILVLLLFSPLGYFLIDWYGFFFFSAGDWTHSLTYTRPALSHWVPSPACVTSTCHKISSHVASFSFLHVIFFLTLYMVLKIFFAMHYTKILNDKLKLSTLVLDDIYNVKGSYITGW
jgi:hypothetical protein